MPNFEMLLCRNMSFKSIMRRELVGAFQYNKEKRKVVRRYIEALPLVLEEEKHCMLIKLLPKLKSLLMMFLEETNDLIWTDLNLQFCEELIVFFNKNKTDVWLFVAHLFQKIDLHIAEKKCKKPLHYYELWFQMAASVLPSVRCTTFIGAATDSESE